MSVSELRWHGVGMTSTGGLDQEPVGAWPGEAIVIAAVIIAVLPLGYLHVSTVGLMDPWTVLISDFVFQPGGSALLGLAAISGAVACTALAVGLRQARLPHPGPPAALFLVAAGALVVVALFPTHVPGTTAGLVSAVHRVAGGVAFAVLPLAAWIVARRAGSAAGWRAAAPVLAWSSGITLVVGVGFLLNHVPIVIAGLPVFPLPGALQRVLLVAMMVVIVLTARATRLAIDHVHVPAPTWAPAEVGAS